MENKDGKGSDNSQLEKKKEKDVDAWKYLPQVNKFIHGFWWTIFEEFHYYITFRCI